MFAGTSLDPAGDAPISCFLLDSLLICGMGKSLLWGFDVTLGKVDEAGKGKVAFLPSLFFDWHEVQITEIICIWMPVSMKSLSCWAYYSCSINSQKHLSGVDYSVPSRVSLWLSFLLIFLSSWLGSEFTTEGLQSAAVTITFALSANIHLLHITPASQLPSVYALWRFLCLPPALLSKYVCPHPY